jgi:hypothetical protein
MDKLATALLTALAGVALVFFAIILGTLMGTLGGLVVGLFFSDTILSTLQRFGVNTAGLAMWQLGATLAFSGGFFRAVVSKAS